MSVHKVELEKLSSNSGQVCCIQFHTDFNVKEMNHHLLFPWQLWVKQQHKLSSLASGDNQAKRSKIIYSKQWRKQWETTPLYFAGYNGNKEKETVQKHDHLPPQGT